MWEKRYQTVLLLLVLQYHSEGCFYSKKFKRQQCDSFDEVEAESTEEWTNVIVRLLHGKPRVALRANSFLRTPNLRELSIHELVNEIEPGAFVGLSKVDTLYIWDNKFRTIDPGIFKGLNNRKVQLINNSMEELPQEMFKHIPRVRLVLIEKNPISVIPVGVFNGTGILDLYLKNNMIERIEEGAFFNMQSLKTLVLSGNKIKSFESRLAIGDNPTLRYLWLARNKLTKITNNMFTTLPFLEQSFLHMNQITEIESDSFLHVPNLQFLDISNNIIEELNPSIATKNGLKKLTTLITHNNRLTFINIALLLKFPKLQYMTLGGNPWQCPCLTHLKKWFLEKGVKQLCDDSYYMGQRPSCVFSSVTSTSCIYDTDVHKDLYSLYIQSLADYEDFQNNMVCDTKDGYDQATLRKVT